MTRKIENFVRNFIYQKNHHQRPNLVKMSYTGIRRKPKEKLAP